LGLVISRQLATLMGGDIGVNSEQGVGSTFWMSAYMGKVQSKGLSFDIGRLLLSESPVQIIARNFRGARLLLAEDDLFNQDVMLELLSETGMVVDVADNGKDALDKMLANDYALVLMDVQMPVMDGLTAARHIRQQTGKAQMPILALTAQALEEDRKLCMEAGMNDYLSKPVDPDMLYAVLLHWLQKSGSQ
jgi:CheY-like chemotaxis protein